MTFPTFRNLDISEFPRSAFIPKTVTLKANKSFDQTNKIIRQNFLMFGSLKKGLQRIE